MGQGDAQPGAQAGGLSASARLPSHPAFTCTQVDASIPSCRYQSLASAGPVSSFLVPLISKEKLPDTCKIHSLDRYNRGKEQPLLLLVRRHLQFWGFQQLTAKISSLGLCTVTPLYNTASKVRFYNLLHETNRSNKTNLSRNIFQTILEGQRPPEICQQRTVQRWMPFSMKRPQGSAERPCRLNRF